MALKIGRIRPVEFNRDKFKELVIYIAKLSQGDGRFGAIKLNKLLFYCDFVSYSRFGRPITGAKYMSLPMGPAPRCLVPVREELQKEGAIDLQRISYHGRTQDRIVALRDPKLELFRPEEIDLIRAVVDSFWERNADQISDLSHEFIGWKVTETNQDIPYSLALLGDREPTLAEIKFAESLKDVAVKSLQKAKTSSKIN